LGTEKARLHAYCAKIGFSIPGALTLKDRRAVVKSIIERLKNRFNLSVSDLDGGSSGAGRAVIGIAAVSNNRELSRDIINKAIDFIAGDGRVELGEVEIAEITGAY
jgi:uncharacterized protein